MQLKQLGVTLALAGMLSTQAYAHEAAVSEAAPLAAAAVQAAPAHVLTQDDLVALFGAQEAGKPLQLAVLSQQEMRETEGALIPAMIIGGMIGAGTYWATTPAAQRTLTGWVTSTALGAIPFGGTAVAGRLAAGSAWNTARGIGVQGTGWRIAYHGPHHSFPLIGRSSHLQLNIWTPRKFGGLPGNGKVYRLPW